MISARRTCRGSRVSSRGPRPAGGPGRSPRSARGCCGSASLCSSKRVKSWPPSNSLGCEPPDGGTRGRRRRRFARSAPPAGTTRPASRPGGPSSGRRTAGGSGRVPAMQNRDCSSRAARRRAGIRGGPAASTTGNGRPSPRAPGRSLNTAARPDSRAAIPRMAAQRRGAQDAPGQAVDAAGSAVTRSSGRHLRPAERSAVAAPGRHRRPARRRGRRGRLVRRSPGPVHHAPARG